VTVNSNNFVEKTTRKVLKKSAIHISCRSTMLILYPPLQTRPIAI